MNASDARRLVCRALVSVIYKGLRPKSALEAGFHRLDERDRAFVMEIVYGVLRQRGLIEHVIGRYLKSPARLPHETLCNIMAGAYQILFMRVPAWAAVNESVRLERKHKALVNAVLRNILRELDRVRAELEAAESRVTETGTKIDEWIMSASLTYSHPEWLVRRWQERFGRHEAVSLMRANNMQPPILLRVNALAASRDEVLRRLVSEGHPAEPTGRSPVGIRLQSALTRGLLDSLRGLAMVQDEAAQIVTTMLAPASGMRILDGCAAPGGKAAHIAEMCGDRAEIIALDSDPARVELMAGNLRSMRYGSIRAERADLLSFDDKRGFDAILIDAPCSSTGVIRRNPDVKYKHSPHDFNGFHERQLALLRAGAKVLRPGGRILYCVCSIEPEEGPLVVEAFLKHALDFYIIKEAPSGSAGPFVRDGYYMTYPHRDGMDGFFGALLGRKSAR